MRNRFEIVIAAFLIVIGSLFLMQNFGVLAFNVWELIWPVLLIVGGLALIFMRPWEKRDFPWAENAEAKPVAIPLDGASRATVRSGGIAGEFHLSADSGENSANLISGESYGDLRFTRRSSEAGLEVQLKMADWGARWNLRLNPKVALVLNFEGGAGVMDFDLTELQVTDFHYHGGVGPLTVNMPAHVRQTTARIDGSVGAVTVNVPASVAATIKVSKGLGDFDIDRNRFQQVSDELYRSANYDQAEQRLDLRLDMGLGAVAIR